MVRRVGRIRPPGERPLRGGGDGLRACARRNDRRKALPVDRSRTGPRPAHARPLRTLRLRKPASARRGAVVLASLRPVVARAGTGAALGTPRPARPRRAPGRCREPLGDAVGRRSHRDHPALRLARRMGAGAPPVRGLAHRRDRVVPPPSRGTTVHRVAPRACGRRAALGPGRAGGPHKLGAGLRRNRAPSSPGGRLSTRRAPAGGRGVHVARLPAVLRPGERTLPRRRPRRDGDPHRPRRRSARGRGTSGVHPRHARRRRSALQ